MGFHHFAQAGLQLLDSRNLLTSALQSAVITGVAVMPGPESYFCFFTYVFIIFFLSYLNLL